MPATGDVVELFGTRLVRHPRPTGPRSARRGLDTNAVWREIEREGERSLRRFLVAVAAVVAGLAGLRR